MNVKITIWILIFALISISAYALTIESDPQKIIDKKNREEIISCMEVLQSYTGSNELLQKEVKKCSEIGLSKIVSFREIQNIRCPILTRSWIEIHKHQFDENDWMYYILTEKETKKIYPNCPIPWTSSGSKIPLPPKWINVLTAENEKRKIVSLYSQYIDSSTITATKNTTKNNLWNYLKTDLKQPIHGKNLCPLKTILRKGWNYPLVQYAYNISCGDMDFIKTIEAESKWDVNALWDSGHSFWLCQIHNRFNKKLQEEYRALKTDNEKIDLCYNQYKGWVKRKVIKTRLYWFNVRDLPQNKNSFTFLQ